MKMIRKNLWIPSLIASIKSKLNKKFKPQDSHGNTKFSTSDYFLSGLAIFHLKYRSLLQLDKDKKNPDKFKNLQNLYLVDNIPSDTQFRVGMDKIKSKNLKFVFGLLISKLLDSKVINSYKSLDSSYNISIDGTGHYSSATVHCDNCCVKNHKDGTVTYYHNALCAVIVNPDKKTVFPIGVEAIKNEDGNKKNDCESNAGKRLIKEIRTAHPFMKIRVLLDALYLNGPFITELKDNKMGFIITAKESHQSYLFEEFNKSNNKITYVTEKDNIQYTYEYAHNLSLNESNKEILVNMVKYKEIDLNTNRIKFSSSWATDLTINNLNVHEFTRVARSRWKIENETFNTLKNQDYNFEHNFGHGNDNLCTNMLILMLIAFCIDQIQQATSEHFKSALINLQSKLELWAEQRSYFKTFIIDSWESLYLALAGKIKKVELKSIVNTS